MEFKINLNKIHYELSEKFSNIEVVEKANSKLGQFVEISVKENLECKIIIKKTDLENNFINFHYLSNPLNENSSVHRTTTVEEFANTIKDIIDNKRFESEYLNNLK
jgi:hypothetical protein